jgi:hypothetical protein
MFGPARHNLDGVCVSIKEINGLGRERHVSGLPKRLGIEMQIVPGSRIPAAMLAGVNMSKMADKPPSQVETQRAYNEYLELIRGEQSRAYLDHKGCALFSGVGL